MNFAEFAKSTATDPQPVYLLMTNDDYLRKRVYEHCLAQVEESARTFNWSVFDLEEGSVADLVNTARTLPWMASWRWVYVKRAEEAGEALVEYLKDPCPRTVMILEVERRPAKWPKLPAVEVERGQDLGHWILQKVRKEGYEIEPRAVQALVELVGENLQLLESELEKQFLYQFESRKITLDSVLEMTQQTREYGAFALVDAIAARHAQQALHILHQLYELGASAPQVLSMLYGNFRRLLVAREMLDRGIAFQRVLSELKIWSYKNKEREIRQYQPGALAGLLTKLCEADRLCKTTSTSADSRTHLERLIIDTCRAGFL